jgi:hypothetical protein
LTDEEEKRVKTYKNLVDNLKNARMELLKNDAIN